MEVSGIVHEIGKVETFGKGFTKQQVVIVDNSLPWENYVPVEFQKERIDLLKNVAVGDHLKVMFHLRGNKWQKDANSPVKYFCAIVASSIVVTKKQEQEEIKENEVPW